MTSPIKRPDPLPPIAEHSLATCRRYFGVNAEAGAASKLKELDPAAYDAVRKSSEAYGLMGPRGYFRPEDQVRPEQRTITASEVEARAGHSREEVVKLFTQGSTLGNQNLSTIKREQPALYASLKTAAISYRVIAPPQPREGEQPVATDPTATLIPADLAEQLGVDGKTTLLTPAALTMLRERQAHDAITKAHGIRAQANEAAQKAEREANEAVARARAAADAVARVDEKAARTAAQAAGERRE